MSAPGAGEREGVPLGTVQAGARAPAAPARRFALVRRDLERYWQLDSRDGAPGVLERMGIVLRTPGLHAVLVYRLGSWIVRSVRSRPLRLPLLALYSVLHGLCIVLWGIHIDPGATIGAGLYVGHFGGVLVGPVRIGRDCNLAHHVTIGQRADGAPGVPALGDRVWVGTGSVIFGRVAIGDGTTIGPLTMVARSLPPRSMVLGNPLRVLRRDYDNSIEIYGTRDRAPGGAGAPPGGGDAVP